MQKEGISIWQILQLLEQEAGEQHYPYYYIITDITLPSGRHWNQEIRMLKECHEQKEKLPGVILPEDMIFTTDLNAAMKDKDVLVLAVPSPFTRSPAKQMAPFTKQGQIIVNVAKGIEEATLMTLSEIIEQEIPQAPMLQYCQDLPMQKRLEREFRQQSWLVLRIRRLRSIYRLFL